MKLTIVTVDKEIEVVDIILLVGTMDRWGRAALE